MRHTVGYAKVADMTVTFALGAFVTACASTPRPAVPPAPAAASHAPASVTVATPSPTPLPPIPRQIGPLAISVIYPHLGTLIEARDSNFILGSVGSGDATLSINGFSVPVQPNGAFLAWLPLPDSATSDYELVAIRGRDTAHLSYPVVLQSARKAERLADSLAPLPPFTDSGRFVALDNTDTTVDDTDRVAIARPVPGGTYKWFLFPGTVVQITGRAPGYTRVRLDSALEVWVASSNTRLIPTLQQFPHAPHRIVGSVRVVPAAGWEDVVLYVGERPPYTVEEDGNDLILTLYGAQGSTSMIQYKSDTLGDLVQAITWRQVTSDRAQFTIHLSRPPYGYLALWSTGNGFTLRVRRPPTVNPSSPLAGRTIAVDAGHPPGGSYGPTGLYEGDVTLTVSQALRAALVARGATVVMTRTTPDPLALEARPVIARRANADALVSIHLNALPDGLNPFVSQGTGTYFFHPHAIALARDVQAAMVQHLGLPDRGVYFDNLALARPTWVPAILCEGAFLIIPEQEAALRTPAYQQAYANGVADGLEHWFRSLAPDPQGK